MTQLLDETKPAPVASTLNISTYKFVPLDRLPERKRQLKELADKLELKGTILLSSEGINMFLAGAPENIQAFFQHLHQDPVFADIQPKESLSTDQPFRRMLVRLKKEIIAFGVQGIDPANRTSPKLPAAELKQWLDEGRPVCLLDVRNEYEIELGTFEGAQHLNIGHFRHFPEAIAKWCEVPKDRPIVMFCTGGIRCEKAGPFVEQAGYQQVYQLDGGILKYFEQVGGAHWRGSCFVFDNRVALNPDLQPTGDQLCYACQAVLHPDDLKSAHYQLGKFCPHCYVAPEQQKADRLRIDQQAVRTVANSQPGCQPYDNFRSIHVSGKWAGLALLDFLTQYQPAVPVDTWRRWIQGGQITFRGQPVEESLPVREGQEFIHHQPETVEPAINPDIQLLYEDESLLAFNKPAPLPTHPSGRFNRNTLTWILGQAFPHEVLRAAHRLDANTSGVIIFCRKQQASRLVQPQFADGRVKKQYLALVAGHPEWEQQTCRARIESKPSASGARLVVEDSSGLECVTHFRVIERLAGGNCLLSAVPETGRTHQIRVHLWHLGYPIIHDPLYLPSSTLGQNLTLGVSDPAMCLHCQSIELVHPISKLRVAFQAPTPSWGDRLVDKQL